VDLAAYRILLKPRDDRLQQAAPLAEEIRSPSVRSFEFSDLLLRQMIGQGTLGKVYRAMTRSDLQPVAVKFLKKRLWSDDRAVASLWREIEAVAAVAHHGIIRHLGRGRTPTGAPFLVMELVEGRDLAGWIDAERPPIGARLCRLADLAKALTAAHAAGVVHGDISLSNVLIAGSRTVLTDFGFAAISTRPPSLLGGTLLFAAPEQFSSAFGAIGPWTDVYSIGALMRVVVGDQTIATPPDADSTIAAIVSGHEASISMESAIPEELRELIQVCTQPDGALRPAMESVSARLSKLASSNQGATAATFAGSPAG
jgi:serine/threonine-protein kinase